MNVALVQFQFYVQGNQVELELLSL